MSEYNNYNGYQQDSQPAPPIVVSPEAAPSYQQPAYQQPVNTATKFNAYGLVSILLAPMGCCCCGLPTLIGLIVGLVGLGKYKKNILCIIGVVLSLLVLGYLAYSIIYTMQHPEEYQQLMDAYMQAMEEQMAQMEQMEQASRFFFGK